MIAYHFFLNNIKEKESYLINLNLPFFKEIISFIINYYETLKVFNFDFIYCFHTFKKLENILSK